MQIYGWRRITSLLVITLINALCVWMFSKQGVNTEVINKFLETQFYIWLIYIGGDSAIKSLSNISDIFKKKDN